MSLEIYKRINKEKRVLQQLLKNQPLGLDPDFSS